MKIHPSPPPSKPRPLGPCPDDRAQNSVQDSLNESSVRPNPTLVFFKNAFSILTPPVPPKTTAKNPSPRGHRVRTGRKKGKSQLVLFVLDSNTNRTNWDFPFLRQASYALWGWIFLGWFWAVLGGGSKLGPHFCKKLGSDLVVQSSR